MQHVALQRRRVAESNRTWPGGNGRRVFRDVYSEMYLMRNSSSGGAKGCRDSEGLQVARGSNRLENNLVSSIHVVQSAGEYNVLHLFVCTCVLKFQVKSQNLMVIGQLTRLALLVVYAQVRDSSFVTG